VAQRFNLTLLLELYKYLSYILSKNSMAEVGGTTF